MGGTSFDVGLITKGVIRINREPLATGMMLGVPMVEVMSIGAAGIKRIIDTRMEGAIARVWP
ncbi:MAG: hypothetical protein HYY20_02305 [Candidatus Tectomicrobia bacterium]|uniref:Hydantoinase A/oxoprolinase domain-containing protein n=1 Tax=Tectimicrobiota bacterium TaxID=2528274 RepID=A0A932FZS9_UNCTE|nr:hypothetical protein [Candidatus Tectomicrobia bacterium]